MKLLLLFLLLALICTWQVQSLRCYTCNPDAKDLVETDCPDEKTFCKSEYDDGSVTRTCAMTCVSTEMIGCCDTDLCNEENMDYDEMI
ncbi:hypothetical protein AAFF_G00038380 [Aldrovandia affinis]|uniref:Snake toxin/toxin-like domain-containing protein n=1 Tax=Aldrovandia affinis TaxID=143900 RepID=A0AAD7T6V1_9TELE|nr:hypothetical protein AAFF_G00038380 [Aldrovandia affinis]